MALTAGDPSLAEELAGRAAPAAARPWPSGPPPCSGLGDLAEVRVLLDGLERASGPAVFWRRLVVEAAAAGRLDIALAVRRAMRRGGLPAPALPDVVVRPPRPGRCSSPAWPPPSCWRWPCPSGWPRWSPSFLALGLGMAVLARRG